jgi:hypothetical protein
MMSSLLVTRPQTQVKDAAFYEVTILLPSGSTQVPERRRSIFLFRKKGDAVEAVEIASGMKFQGSARDKSMIFIFNAANAEANAKAWKFRNFSEGTTATLTFDGSVGDEKFSGAFNFSGNHPSIVLLEGVELASVWACSNHKEPTHTAKTEDEMRSLTSKNQCQGWHKLRPADIN